MVKIANVFLLKSEDTGGVRVVTASECACALSSLSFDGNCASWFNLTMCELCWRSCHDHFFQMTEWTRWCPRGSHGSEDNKIICFFFHFKTISHKWFATNQSLFAVLHELLHHGHSHFQGWALETMSVLHKEVMLTCWHLEKWMRQTVGSLLTLNEIFQIATP